ncbi:response regulator [soil metagenome]
MEAVTKPKLLLADDSVTIRKVVELTFADEGIDVTAVSDAESAMQKFVEIQPDIVLIDVDLHGTSGYHICQMIKQDEATKHIPVLLLVGSFEPFDQDEAERVEADGFLTKPFHSIRDLVARVFDLLGREAVAPPAPEEITERESTPESDSTEEPAQKADQETTTESELADEPISTSEPEAVEQEPPESFTRETDDIENLYRSSFAQTVEIEEFDTVDDLFGDAGLDDEMIEASYPTAASLPTVAYGEEIAEFVPADDPALQTKEFDWSPASIIDDHEPVSETEQVPEVEVEPQEQRTVAASEPEHQQPNGFEPKFVFEDIPNEDGEEQTQKPVEESPETVDPEPAEENPDIPDEPEAAQLTAPEETEAAPAMMSAEPSAEFINLLAQRIVEKLSDRVIREVAQEAVPRIAEKLIREALEDEKNA